MHELIVRIVIVVFFVVVTPPTIYAMWKARDYRD